MQREIKNQIAAEVALKFRNQNAVKWAVLRNSWRVAKDAHGKYYLTRCRYFSLFAKRAHPAEQEPVDIMIDSAGGEGEVREWLRIECGLKLFMPGTDDAKSLLEVWA